MDKIKSTFGRVLCVLVLSFSMLIGSAAAVAVDGIAAAGVIIGLIQVAQGAYDSAVTAAEKAAALEDFQSLWQPTLRGEFIEVSADDLSSLVVNLNGLGCACEIVYVSTQGGYFIQALDKVVFSNNTLGDTEVDISNDFLNAGQANVFLYSTTKPSPSIMDSIEFFLTSTLAEHISWVQSKLSVLTGYVDGLESQLSSLTSYVDGLETTLSSVLSGVSGIGNQMDTVIDLLTTDSYTCISTSMSGEALPKVKIPYDVAVELCADLNKRAGETINCWNSTGSSYYDAVIHYAYILDSGYIRVILTYGDSSTNRFLCTNNLTVYTVDMTGNHTSVLGNIYSAVDGLESGVSGLATQLTAMGGYLDGLEGQLSTLIGHTDGLESQLTTLGGYLDGLESGLSGLGSQLTTLITGVTGIGDQMDTVIDLLTTESYTCISTSVGDVALPKVEIPYAVAVELCADLNKRAGEVINCWDSSGTSYYPATIHYAFIISSGYIRVDFSYDDRETNRFLCTNNLTVYKVDMTGDHSVVLGNIYSAVGGLESGISSISTTLSNIESTLSKIAGEIEASVDDVTNIEITEDNDNYNIFYVDDPEGDDQTIIDLTGDALDVLGDLLNFLYQVAIKDAFSVGGGVDGLRDFYLDDAEVSVDVWGS